MKKNLLIALCLVMGAQLTKLEAKDKTPVVAIIGVGVDTTFTPVRERLYRCWDFIGTKDGGVTEKLSRVGDREFYRLKDKYQSYLYQSGKPLQWDEMTASYVEVPYPANREEFLYFFNKVLPETQVGQNYLSIDLAKHVISYIHRLDIELRKKYPGKTLTDADFESLFTGVNVTEVTTIMHDLVSLLFMSAGSKKWDVLVQYADTKYLPFQRRVYTKRYERTVLNERKAIGDNPYDINDRKYGNANLAVGNTLKGTLIAERIVDVAPANTKVMLLCIDADFYGEPYMKDMALAIRRAVDYGADVIQMGKTNTLYPQPWSKWVNEALLYAEQKGVLVVMPVMDLSYNLDDQPFYPNRHVGGRELNNIITVAASDSIGNPYVNANFSQKELDLFAYGVNIPFDYQNSVGTSSEFAASLVSAVALRMKSEMPELTPAQIRKVMMETVTPRGEVEVQKSFHQFKNGRSAGMATDLFLFEELCKSGGVLNPPGIAEWIKNHKR